MSISAAIYSTLKDTDAVFLLCGDRIYPLLASQNAKKPYITYSRISTVRESSLKADTDIANSRFQVSAWSDNIDEANEVSTAIRGALQRFRGSVGGETILDIYVSNENDLYDSEAEIFQIATDYEIWYRE